VGIGWFAITTIAPIATPGNSKDRWMPKVPSDMYFMLGFEGQHVTIIPSKKLLIARGGLSRPEELWDHESLVATLIEAIEHECS